MTTVQDLPLIPPTSRFKVFPVPVVAPGKCAVCGAVDRPVVDFGMSLDFYGAVYLCVTCLTEASTLLGMVTRDELLKVEAGLAQSLEERLSAMGLRTITDEQYVNLTMALGGLSSVVLSASSSDNAVLESQADASEPDLFSVLDETVGESKDGELGDAGSPEQDDNVIVDEGPISVPSSSRNGNDFSL